MRGSHLPLEQPASFNLSIFNQRPAEYEENSVDKISSFSYSYLICMFRSIRVVRLRILEFRQF
jgi:hypothetical protein